MSSIEYRYTKLKEIVEWIKDICADYADKPALGLKAIRIFLNDADTIIKNTKEKSNV